MEAPRKFHGSWRRHGSTVEVLSKLEAPWNHHVWKHHGMTNGRMEAPWKHHGSTMEAPIGVSWEHRGSTMEALRNHGSTMEIMLTRISHGIAIPESLWTSPWKHHASTTKTPRKHCIFVDVSMDAPWKHLGRVEALCVSAWTFNGTSLHAHCFHRDFHDTYVGLP